MISAFLEQDRAHLDKPLLINMKGASQNEQTGSL